MSSIIPSVDGAGEEPLVSHLADCLRQLDGVDADTASLLNGMTEVQFHWSPVAAHWSIEQCLVHLVIVGGKYLPIIDEAMENARADRLLSRGPFRYGFIERWFVRSTEPPPGIRLRTPTAARPPDDQPLPFVIANFLTMQDDLRKRIRAANGLDLARAKVTSPFIRALKMGLGPCFEFLGAHERRHLWQAWQVRKHERFPVD
jgi:hypothetical protein